MFVYARKPIRRLWFFGVSDMFYLHLGIPVLISVHPDVSGWE